MSRPNGLVSRGIVLSVIIVLGSNLVSLAAELHVPGSHLTIQAAIDAAGDTGDEVVLAPGTYTGDGNRDLDLRGKTVLVRGTHPTDPAVVAATVIDCQGTAGSPHVAAILNCNSDVSDAGLAGLTITGAHDLEGAVVCDGFSTPVIRDCVIRNNSGSGIYCRYGASPAITGCRIEANVTSGDGGGICLSLEGQPTIEGCVIRGNNAATGGGIYCYEAWPDVVSSEISGNAAVTGGGIYWKDSGPLLLGCTLAGNSATAGGALYGLSGNYYDEADLSNCVLWGNHAGDGRQVTLATMSSSADDDTLHVDHSLIQGGQRGIAAPTGWTIDWQTGNLQASADPLFAAGTGADGDWATWQDNVYCLTGGSPCIDAGDPAGNYTGQTDAAGQARLVGAKVDLGAYEAAPFTQASLVGDISGDGHVDTVDLLNFAGSFGRSQGTQGYSVACDFDASSAVDLVDLLMLADNFGV